MKSTKYAKQGDIISAAMTINFVGIWSSLVDLFTFNLFNSDATSLEV